MKTIQEILSENLKRIRKNKGYNQQKVGENAGMLASTYSRIEGMKVTPTIETVDKIAKALEIDIYSLLNDADVKSNSLHDRILRIESLSEYNQKIINLMIDTLIEKDNLEKNQEVKMNMRLEELREISGKG
ncbi:helix-turn-helix domain-containing protein [Polaribacter vadi]|uniref:helix-turn-helix domain-containing protein n=1 Tax=Polaribacter vadi TaxID=1774273 RepID=UPI0030EC4817